MFKVFVRRYLSLIYVVVTVGLLVCGIIQLRRQQADHRYVAAAAAEAAQAAAAQTPEAEVIALRDYVRAHVGPDGYSPLGRPFLRKSAAETLRSGQAFCGGAVRAFVNLAAARGVRAQRLYLEGLAAHVVAQVWLDDGRSLVVDPYRDFYFAEDVPVAAVTNPEEFSAYYTLGWRQLSVLHLLPSHAIYLGWPSFLLENPPALLSLLSFALATAVLIGRTRWPLGRTADRNRPAALDAR